MPTCCLSLSFSVQGLDGPSLRLDPIGRDSEGSHYWYFFGVRLYKEEAKKKKKESGTTPAKKARGKGGATSKATPTGKKRSTPANSRTPAGRRSNARGRGAKKGDNDDNNSLEVKGDEESAVNGDNLEEDKAEVDSIESGSNSVASTTGWHVVCNTLEEWEELVENLGGTKHQETRRLIRALQGMDVDGGRCVHVVWYIVSGLCIDQAVKCCFYLTSCVCLL